MRDEKKTKRFIDSYGRVSTKVPTELKSYPSSCELQVSHHNNRKCISCFTRVDAKAVNRVFVCAIAQVCRRSVKYPQLTPPPHSH